MNTNKSIYHLLDWDYGRDGDAVLQSMLLDGVDPNLRNGSLNETPIHIAARRRRLNAIQILLDYGADINAKTKGGKTAYAHSIRRGFSEIVEFLHHRGADTELHAADQFAVAVVNNDMNQAKHILDEHPSVIKTGNGEEDRLLSDMTGRNHTDMIHFLIHAGADLSAKGLDNGAALHIAAWFGQPKNAQVLIDAGAPLNDFDNDHQSSPLGWAVHGSRYSGGAEIRQDCYVELVKMLLEAGSSLHYPDNPNGDAYKKRLFEDASPQVLEILQKHTPH